VPLPLRLTICGLLVALSWSGKLPVRLPAAVGLKVTLIVHEPRAARLTPQVLVCAKSPVTGIPEKLTAAPPSLVTVKILARLVVRTFRALNFNFDNEIDNAPGVAVGVGVAVTVGVAEAVGVEVTVGVAV
jgi:hypothetical protein